MRPLFITFDLGAIDSHALIITIVTYCVVFFSLAILGFLIRYIFLFRESIIKRQLNRKTEAMPDQAEPGITGDENAAIAAALFLFFSELHDEEKYVMTVKKVSRTYSPWSSKIYGIWNNIKYW
jgi:glutaconyl-CoA/methylmalonyl-CoA decarboxylase subunit delta